MRRPLCVGGIAAVVLVLSLPWITAELGFHLPGDVFMGEELMRTEDGTLALACVAAYLLTRERAILRR